MQSRGGQTYYLIIDYDKPIDEENEIYETYFLNLVDERDLLSLLSEEDMPTPTPTPSPTPVPTQAPTPVPAQTQQEKDTGTGWLALAVLCLLAAGGALWFLKSRKGGAPARPAFMEYEMCIRDSFSPGPVREKRSTPGSCAGPDNTGPLPPPQTPSLSNRQLLRCPGPQRRNTQRGEPHCSSSTKNQVRPP